MDLKKGLFGYKKKDVEELLKSFNDIVEIQKRDIQYLKQDNAELKNTLFEVSTELAHIESVKKAKD